jgi:uncharacterized protein (TIGR00288 family)
MTQERVMLLIDADNVSVDVIEQALQLVHKQHGAVHVRRAYCTAEHALKNQSAFRRLGLKPMVNLATGKNSTDIALAVDAIDLVLAERPDIVVICSSDSDFAPLVQRLREKGCEVRGIGQQGKTGDETQQVYDDYTVLEHRRTTTAAKKTARKTSARAAPGTRARKTAAVVAPAEVEMAAADEAPTPVAAPAARTRAARKTTAARKTAGAAAKTTRATKPTRAKATAAAAAEAADAGAPPPAKPARKRAARKTAAAAPPPAAPVETASAAAVAARPAPTGGTARSGTTLDAVLDCLPELRAGQVLALNVAVERLRGAQLLGRNSSSLKLFSQLGDRVELLPPGKPSQVRLRG